MYNVNEHGVVTNPDIVLEYSDKYISLYIKSAKIGGVGLFGYGFTITGFLSYMGVSCPVSTMHSRTFETIDEVMLHIYRGIRDNLSHNAKGTEYINKLDIFKHLSQPSLFNHE